MASGWPWNRGECFNTRNDTIKERGGDGWGEILDHARRSVLSEPHTPAESFRKSSSLRNLSGRFLIALSVLRSSASSTRSSSFRYSSMLKMTAVGFPPRITISGSFRFRLAFIRLHLDGRPRLSLSHNPFN